MAWTSSRAAQALPDELAAAIQSLARRLRRSQQDVWRLQPQRNQLLSPSGQCLPLTGGEVGPLRAMAMAPDRWFLADIESLDIRSKRGLAPDQLPRYWC